MMVLGWFIAICGVILFFILARVIARSLRPRLPHWLARLIALLVFSAAFCFAGSFIANISVNLIWPITPVTVPEDSGIMIFLFPVFILASVFAALQNLEEMLALWAILTLVFFIKMGRGLFRAAPKIGVDA